MKLYEIQEQYQRALDNCLRYSEENDGIVADDLAMELEQFCDAKENKIEQIALYVKNELSLVSEIDAEIKQLQKRKKSHKLKAEWLKYYVSNFVDSKFETAKVKISFRNSKSVGIDEDAIIPDEYMVIKKMPNKTELKKAINSGVEIKGVGIIEKKSIQIK